MPETNEDDTLLQINTTVEDGFLEIRTLHPNGGGAEVVFRVNPDYPGAFEEFLVLGGACFTDEYMAMISDRITQMLLHFELEYPGVREAADAISRETLLMQGFSPDQLRDLSD